jgi:hypothetical protein
MSLWIFGIYLTQNSDIVISRESWLTEEISNAEVFRDGFRAFRRARKTRGGGMFICVKITLHVWNCVQTRIFLY